MRMNFIMMENTMLWRTGIFVLATWIVICKASHMDSLAWDKPGPRPSLKIKRAAKVSDPTLRDCSDPDNVYLPPSVTETGERLQALRQQMRNNGYDAYIVPSEDEHLTEYIAPRDQRRRWITGFTGSAGVAVVTDTEAAMWTDGRYFVQAERQMDCNWMLMRSGLPDTPSIDNWIASVLKNSSVVGANPFVFSLTHWTSYETSFKSSGISIVQSIPDIVDVVWTDRPGPIGTEIIVFPLQYAGKPWNEKVTDARLKMTENGADFLLLTLLDEVAWFLNLRGNDIPYTPVFTSYALVGMSDVKLYINMSLQSEEITDHLVYPGCVEEKMCVVFRDYSTARGDLEGLPEGSKVWMSSATTTYGMYSAVDPARQIQTESPVKVPKAVKNEVEREGMKKAHIYDAIALCEYFIWLEENVPKGLVDEISGSEKLESLRRAQEASKGPSFGSISASGPNGAVIHYGSTEETNRKLTTEDIYLIDSGGHYFEGTTDVTRSLHFGTPTDFQKEAFTRVLMGVIDVSTAVFPSTVNGKDIGFLARRHLYKVGLSYRHGSGHGVGQYLTIHEYPPAIDTVGRDEYPFQVGMFTSIEPGYYEDGEFGIRHENVVMVTNAETKYNFGDYAYLTMEDVTLVPFQQKMIDISLLSDDQLQYLNDYHAKTLKVVGDEALEQDKQVLYDWLETATLPMTRNPALRNEVQLLFVLCHILLSAMSAV